MFPIPEEYNSKLDRFFYFFLRFIGCFECRGSSWRFNWGEVSFRPALGLSYSIYHDRAHLCISPLLLSLFIRMPVLITFRPGTEDWNASYGVSIFTRDMHLNWRTKCKIIHFPWDWDHVRTSILRPDGSEWRKLNNDIFFDYRAHMPVDFFEHHAFHYLRRNGEAQAAVAKIFGKEMEWRWRCMKWSPYPRIISRSIEIEFNKELGERVGSWKGGVMGTGATWKKGERMVDALRRFEREAQFR